MTADTLVAPRGLSAVGGLLEQGAAEFGTPLYVIDQASLAWSASQVEAAFPDPWLRQFSVKANDLPAIVAFLADRGWGANVVSSGEWAQARHAGVSAGAVTFEGIGKTDADLAEAVDSAARGEAPRWLALESPAEASRLAEYADQAGLGAGDRPPLDVLLRLNPQVQPETLPVLAVGASSSKFGMERSEIVDLVRSGLLRGGLRLRGIHVHAGSDLRDVAAWADAGVRAVGLLAEIAAIDANADTVDFGGGFPLPSDGRTPTPTDFHRTLVQGLTAAGLLLPARVAVEPGRYLVGAAGWLVSSVLHSRSRPPYPQQVVLDAGMTELIRPALYGSRHPVHPLLPADNPAGPLTDTSVEGPICESTDSFGVHPLPRLERGDLVAIEGAGAYAASFTSRYNGRPHPTEVMAFPDGTLEKCDRAAVTRLSPPPKLNG